MDSTLKSLGFPRKTIGINVTQIGLDDVRQSFFFNSLFLNWRSTLDLTALTGGSGISSDDGRPSSVISKLLLCNGRMPVCASLPGTGSAIASIVSAISRWRWCRFVDIIVSLCAFHSSRIETNDCYRAAFLFIHTRIVPQCQNQGVYLTPDMYCSLAALV